MSAATIFAIGQGLSAAGTLMAGIGAKQQSRLDAFNIETEKTLNKTQALQLSRARRQEFDLATASNIATFAAAGRDISADKSVRAFLERQKETFSEDVNVLANNTYRQNLKMEQEKLATLKRGQNALISSIFNAGATAAEGYVGYQRIKLRGY